jgi:hypothetical protein
MALNIGSIEINNVYRGATPLSAIYRGANLVWPINIPQTWTINTWSFDAGVGPYRALTPITTWDFTNGLGPNQKITN